MQVFREFGKTQTSRAMLLLLVVCFGAWGVGDYLTNRNGGDALTVNGETISANELDRIYRGRIAQVEQLTGRKADPAMLAQLGIAQTTLTEAINRAVLRQAAKTLNLMPAASLLRKEIAESEEFQTNGKFDQRKYEDTTARVGLTTTAYEQSIASDLSVRMIGQLVKVAATAPVTLKPLEASEKATYTVEAVSLDAGDAGAITKPTDAQINEFYTANSRLYQIAEKRSYKVLTLSPDAVVKTLTVSDKQITDYYNENKEAFAVPERRKVRHILVADKETAQKLAPQATDLTAFETLAREHSLDTISKAKGGDIGTIAKRDVVPAFADMAFSMDTGKVSVATKSPFGWHLIWVEKVEPAHTQPLDEAKARIKAELLNVATEEAMQDLDKVITDRIAGGQKLDEIGKATGLPVANTVMAQLKESDPDAAMTAVAFGLEAGEISQPMDNQKGGVAYLEVTQVVPVKLPPLAEVKDKVAEDWTNIQTQLAMHKKAEAILALARGPSRPATLADAAKQNGVAAPKVETLSFSELAKTPEWLQPQLTNLFQLPVGGVVATPIQNDKKLVMVRLAGRVLGTPTDADLTSAAKQYRQRMQLELEAFLINYLGRTADIETNASLMKQVFGDQVQVDAN